MIQNQSIEVTTYYRSDNININEVNIDVIKLLTELLSPIFEKHVYE